jgi:cysteinyl-tRNA synthetase
VRNITDAGHFEEEGREAQDKVSEKAKLEQMEPMELVHKYTNLFHWAMRQLNCVEPSIEPTATGHIVEQIEMIKTIIKEGYAYEVNGSVYFDVIKYAENYPYGKLSGRVMDDLLETTRDLEGQEEKRNKQDFALWKAAPPRHIMRWQSPWGEGFPGWHIECSAMATKYLGRQFDIHGGGMDLQFPHHESEIAQSTICNHEKPARYWLHNNMITINGRKMGKSYNNVIKLTELFSGNHPLLTQGYSPMTVRFFILQTHYRSTLDFSNEALQASEKGLKRLWEAYETLQKLGEAAAESPAQESTLQNAVAPGDVKNNDEKRMPEAKNSAQPSAPVDTELDARIRENLNQLEGFMYDDFNTAKVLANLFEIVPVINSIKDQHISLGSITRDTFQLMQSSFKLYLEDIFGLHSIHPEESGKLRGALDLLISIRTEAKSKKDFVTSDRIRAELLELGIQLKDEKDGSMSYTLE